MSKARLLAPLAVVVVLIAVFGVGLTLKPGEIPSPLIDKPAPAFSLPVLGQPDQLIGLDTVRREVSLLNVWASWCVACRVEHPLLMELAARDVVPIYGLNYKDEAGAALRWLDRHGDPYVASAQDLSGDVAIDYGVYGAPETFLIDREGVIRFKQIGPITPEVLEEELLPLIRQLQGAAS